MSSSSRSIRWSVFRVRSHTSSRAFFTYSVKYTDVELITMAREREHSRTDGGIHTPDPPPIDVITEDTLAPETLA